MSARQLSLLVALAEVIAVAWGTGLFSRRFRAGQYIRAEGPRRHLAKAGTPTMAGIVPLVAISCGVLVLWLVKGRADLRVGFALAAAWLGGGIGLVDDLLSQKRHTSLGLKPGQKLLLGLVGVAVLAAFLPRLAEVRLAFPFSRFSLPCGAIPLPAALALLLLGFWGTTNGVNLTDGLDGLAPGAVLISLLGFIPLLWGQAELVETAIISAGAVAGFLWVNAYPAGAFLGDVGSMGLGGLLFGLAFSGGSILFLPLIGGLFVLETGSVILQVVSYKLTGRRLFKMSPLHHHLEEGEPAWQHWLPGRSWPEPKVVVRLWILAAGFVLLGLLGIR